MTKEFEKTGEYPPAIGFAFRRLKRVFAISVYGGYPCLLFLAMVQKIFLPSNQKRSQEIF